jgi:protein tyrosine/serine phosphatase
MKRFFGTFTSALVLAALFAGGLPAQTYKQAVESTSATAAETLKPRGDINGLSNFAKVSDALYRGAQPTKEGFAELKKLGVKTIINLRARHSDEEFIKGLELNYFSIPINTWDLDNKHTARFLSIVLDKANQPVFVHCQHGSDRTGTMVAVYRVYAQKWKAEEAMKELPVFGFHKIWVNLKKYLTHLDIKKVEAEIHKLREGAAVKKP